MIMSKQLTQEQIDKYSETFKLFARKTIGIIKTEEFFAIMRRLDLSPTETQLQMVQEIESKFCAQITYENFLHLMQENNKSSDYKAELPEDKVNIENTKISKVSKISKSLTKKEIVEYTDTFECYDINSSGTIKTKEFFVILRYLDLNPTETQLKMVEEIDSEYCGKITFEKFIVLMKQNRKPSDIITNNIENVENTITSKPLTQKEIEEYIETFEFYDRNSSGTIETEEFFVIMRCLDLNPTETQLKMVEEIDSENCGKITLEKFFVLMKQNRKPSDNKDELLENIITNNIENMENTITSKTSKETQLNMIQEIDSEFCSKITIEEFPLLMKENVKSSDNKEELSEHLITDNIGNIENTKISKKSETLTEKEINEYTKAFKYYDRNSSGTIKTEEFFVIIRYLDLSPTETQLKMVEEIDSENCGIISIENFFLLMKENRKPSDNKEELLENIITNNIENIENTKTSKPLTQKEIDEYTETFEFYDRNSNRTIKTEEFFVIMRCLDLNPTEIQLNMIQEIDSEFYGEITFEKFIHLMKENRKSLNVKEELPICTTKGNIEKINSSDVFEILTRKEIDEYAAIFKLHDKLSCGTIKTEEFFVIMRSLNLIPTEVQLKMVEEIDSNFSGEAPFEKFLLLMKENSKSSVDGEECREGHV